MKISNEVRNVLWFLGTISLPHAIFFIGNMILAVFWRDPSEITAPSSLLLPTELGPLIMAIAASMYCFSEIRFSNAKGKILALSAIIFSFYITALISAIMVSCYVWRDCL